jgi:hypothetical protein
VGHFKRGLSTKFVEGLDRLREKARWWRDVLADPSLIIGIRDEKFDVYWHGQSIFNVAFDNGRVKVNTHVKYLLDPDRSDRVSLNDDGAFDVKPAPIITLYESEITLKKLKRAADLFSGEEKQGVHAIVRANENIVDVEVELDATKLDTKRDHPRIDFAAFETQSNGIELVFWEAKLFANKELRASGSSKGPDVVEQINDYQKVLEERRQEVVSSYQRVAENLVAIAKMSNGKRSVGCAIQTVAGGVKLAMNSPPQVKLVIFGYDADQDAQSGIGHKHFAKLEALLGPLHIQKRGKADGLKLR